MHIEISTDSNIDSDIDLRQRVAAEVEDTLSRFGDHLTRIEVHLGDVNAHKGGNTDVRCAMEARPAGHEPLAVIHHAAAVTEAYRGAAKKLQRLLYTRLSRMVSRRGRDTIRRPDPLWAPTAD
jgi:hypothetical protein